MEFTRLAEAVRAGQSVAASLPVGHAGDCCHPLALACARRRYRFEDDLAALAQAAADKLHAVINSGFIH